MRRRVRFVLAVLVVVTAAPVVSAAVPQLIHFQGMLEDEFGVPLQGTYSVTFSIYDQESDGSALWSETRDVDCTDGLFSVVLGENTPVSLDFDTQYWLGCQVSGDPEMAPRYQLASVPYAFWTAVSDSSAVSGWSRTSAEADVALSADVCDSAQRAALADYADASGTALDAAHAVEADLADSANGVRWGHISGMPGGFADGVDNTGSGGDSDWTVSGSDMYSAVSGDVGIGITNPGAKLDAQGTFRVGQDGTGYDVSLYGSDSGSRFYWDAERMALRAGRDFDGSHWASDSLGSWSVALGSDCKATSTGSVALGGASARGHFSFAAGSIARAFGGFSTAIGGWCEAKGGYGAAIGELCKANGLRSYSFGSYASAYADSSCAIGRHVLVNAKSAFAIGTGLNIAQPMGNYTMNSLAVGFNSDIPTFFVGGSSGSGTTGRVGIGTSAPSNETKLHVQCASDNFGILVDAEGTSGSEIGLHTANSRYSGLAKNATWVNPWQRFNDSDGAFLMQIDPSGIADFKVAGPGSGNITWTNAIRIAADGKVGIGHDVTPARTLDVLDVMRLRPSSEPAFPAEGDIYMDSTTHKLRVYDGTVWRDLW